jgi:hypothetical protein
MHRTWDAQRINEIANHPAVKPFVDLGVLDEIDVRELLGHPGVIAFLDPHGCFIAVEEEPQVFSVHTMFLPEGRGPHVVTLARRQIREMFTIYEAKRLTTFVADDNKPARVLATRVGFKPVRRGQLGHWQGTHYSLEKHECQ